MMILSVCFNPYIDVHLEVESLLVGMSNKVVSKNIFYTGKGINVAVDLARLGVDSLLTGFMFDENGRLFEQELHKEGVEYKFVWCEGRAREKYKFIDHKSMLTEVNDVPYIIEKDKLDLLLWQIKQLSCSSEAVVLSGGQIGKTKDYSGISPEFFTDVLSSVPEGVFKVVDAEGDYLLNSLKCGVDLVKPNIDELQRTLNKTISGKQDLMSAIEQLISLGAKKVIVSLGKKGAVISDGKSSFYCRSINVAMNSTEGAGDAMVAGATKALVEGEDLVGILRSGVAAGTAAVTIADNISFNKSKYEEIKKSLIVKEI